MNKYLIKREIEGASQIPSRKTRGDWTGVRISSYPDEK